MSYTKYNPLCLLFKNPIFNEYFKSTKELIDTSNRDEIIVQFEHEELKTVLEDIGFIFEVDNGMCLNQHHELFQLMSMPHIERVIFDEVVLDVFVIHIHKRYLSCIPLEILCHYLDYSEDEIQRALNVLKRFRLIRRSMVIEGQSKQEESIDKANEIITKMDSLMNLINDEDTDTVPVDDLENIIGNINVPYDDDQCVLTMTEAEYMESVHKAATTGVDTVSTKQNISTVEEGSSGTTLKKDNEWVTIFSNLTMSLLDGVESIHHLNDSVDNNE